jgi:hypothetical protein
MQRLAGGESSSVVAAALSVAVSSVIKWAVHERQSHWFEVTRALSVIQEVGLCELIALLVECVAQHVPECDLEPFQSLAEGPTKLGSFIPK